MPENEQKIRIGIVGAGRITEMVHLPILKTLSRPAVQIAYLADVKDPSPLAARYQTEAVTLREISELPECDAVFLGTPVGVREPYLREFGKRKTPVFTEKPFAINQKKHIEFLELNPKTDCNYMRETYGSIQLLQKIINNHSFGKVKRIAASEGAIVSSTGKSKTHYQTDMKQAGGGVLIERGCHLLSQLGIITNYSTQKLKKAKGIFQEDLDIEMYAEFSISLNKRKIPMGFHVSMIQNYSPLIRVECEEATFECNPQAVQSPLCMNKGEQTFVLPLPPDAPQSFTHAYYLKWKNFLDNVQTNNFKASEKSTSLWTTNAITQIYSRTRD